MPSNRLQPALLGGLFIGVLSALPIVSFFNCCCLWIIGGGIVAAYLTQNSSPTAISVGDGALAGLMAGIFGTIVNTVLWIPIHAVMGPIQSRMAERLTETARDIPDSLRVLMQPGQMGGGSFLLSLVIGFFFMLVLSVIFATVGGMIGAAIFGRNKPRLIDAPPPPPI
ncbi:MAG: hypothetical protein ACM3NQ_19475 [Bacteroidales bacterium]